MEAIDREERSDVRICVMWQSIELKLQSPYMCNIYTGNMSKYLCKKVAVKSLYGLICVLICESMFGTLLPSWLLDRCLVDCWLLHRWPFDIGQAELSDI